MTAHTLESLAPDAPSSLSILGGDWVATCSCHNPDDAGAGRADFRGDDAYLAYLAWAEHAATQPDDIPADRVIFDTDGFEVRVGPIPDTSGTHARVFLMLSLPDDDGTQITAWLTDEQWNMIRGAR